MGRLGCLAEFASADANEYNHFSPGTCFGQKNTFHVERNFSFRKSHLRPKIPFGVQSPQAERPPTAVFLLFPRAIAMPKSQKLLGIAIAPCFSLLLETRGYAAIFGSIIETSLSAVLGSLRGFAVLRFHNRSAFLLRRDGPCRLPVVIVHWTHLLIFGLMTLYLRKATERSSALPLMLRSSS